MKPDTRDTTFTPIFRGKKIPPKIIFSEDALKWIEALVDIHSTEVGWYAIVDERPNYTFFVRDVFYPKHSEANFGTCEISAEGESEMANWLMDNGREDDIEKTRLWGHSHHTMGTTPSGQDESQAIDRMTSTQSFLIRIICNKGGEMSCSFFDWDNQIRFDNIKWTSEKASEDELNSQRYLRLSAIMEDAQLSEAEKVKLIKDALDENSAIRKKVSELKEVNIPIKTYEITSNKKQRYSRRSTFYNNSGGNMPGNKIQETMDLNDIPRSEIYDVFDDDLDEIESGLQRNINSGDESLFSEEELKSMVNNFDNSYLKED